MHHVLEYENTNQSEEAFSHRCSSPLRGFHPWSHDWNHCLQGPKILKSRISESPVHPKTRIQEWPVGCVKKPKISQITLLFWYVLWLWYLRNVPKNWTIPTKIEWPQPLFSFGPFKRVKRLKNGSKNLIFKNWLDTRPKMETHDPNVYPTILGGVSRGFWTPFLNRGARSAIFWHLKTGTFAGRIFTSRIAVWILLPAKRLFEVLSSIGFVLQKWSKDNIGKFDPLYCTFKPHFSPLLAPQSGALRISAYGDFQSHPNPSTYSFRAFKPFYSDQKQCK